MNQYSASEFITTAYAYVITKIFYRNARLIRRPFYIRGKGNMVLQPGLTTGHGCRFDLLGKNKTLFIGRDCQVGDNVHIVATERVEIGENCLLASKIFISDTSHGIYDNSDSESNPFIAPNDRKLHTRPVEIGNRVWVGENVCILPGVTIGDGCVIGANSVVTQNIPDGSIVTGIPARIIKKWNSQEEMWEKYDRFNGNHFDQK